jgi:hypothetical protein
MFGEDALSNAWTQGLEELRAANEGKMAMDAPAIEPQHMEAPQSGYEQMLAEVAQQPVVEQSQGMER